MRSPEVSPSSLDVVIAPVICWQKRGTEKIWRLGKTSTPLNADVAQLDRAEQGKCRVPVVGSSPTVCTIGVTSCLAAARSVSLRKWSFLCAVRKRQDDGIYLFIGWHRLCKDERMRPTYRRRAEKFRGWFGCRRVRRKSEAKPVDVEAAWWRLSLDKAAV